MGNPRIAAAINLSDTSVEVVVLSRSKDQFVIESYARSVLESGTVVDAKIVNQEKLRSVLSDLFKKATPNPITCREVMLSVPESKVFVQTYDLPATYPIKAIPPALMSQARESLPIDVSLASADFRPVAKNDTTVRYAFAVTYRDLVEEYVEFFRSLQMRVLAITMESIAVAAATLDPSVDETVMIIDCGARTTIASVFDQGVFHETVNVRLAGDVITAALADRLKISMADADQRKMIIGLTSVDPKDADVVSIIKGQLQPLKDELLVFVKYFEQKFSSTIARIVITGGSSELPGLREYLEQNVGLPTTFAETRADFVLPEPKPSISKFLVSLGLGRLALEGSFSINFLAHTARDWQSDVRTLKKPGADTSNTAAEQVPVTKRSIRFSKRLKIIVMVVMVIIGFGAVWFASTIPMPTLQRPSIMPLITRTQQPVPDREYSFSFTMSIGTPSTTTPAQLHAELVQQTIDKEMTYSTPDVTNAIGQLRAKGSSSPSDDEIAAEIAQELALKEWKELLPAVQQAVAREKFLLPSFRSVSIASAEARGPDPLNPDQRRVRLKATYEAVVISNRSSYDAVENDSITAFTDENPGWSVKERRYRFVEVTPNTLLRVTAIVVFTRHSQ